MTKILCFSTLFPNAQQKNHGIFVENRLRHILQTGGVSAKVLAPVPYFPFRSEFWGRYGNFAKIPSVEQRHGMEIHHPRFLVVPKIGNVFTPHTLAASALESAKSIMQQGFDFDVIDAHYFYPDGVAACILARKLRKPFVVTSRGSDLTQHARNGYERKMILDAAHAATALITVSSSLKTELMKLGLPPDRIAVLRNGVETEIFCPPPGRQSDQKNSAARFSMVSVGALIPRKAHEITIRAMSDLPDCELKIAGAGPLHGELTQLIEQLGLTNRVRLLGELAHRDLPKLYGDADAMVLMSSREGWANVILESLACGTPALVSDVGGAREIIQDEVAGIVLAERSTRVLVSAIKDLQAKRPDRNKIRDYAETFGWKPVAAANARLLQAAAAATSPLRNIDQEFSVTR